MKEHYSDKGNLYIVLICFTLRVERYTNDLGLTVTYAYDPIGNRTTSAENGVANLYAANELNQYTTLNPGTTNSTAFAYDADGNMTQYGDLSFFWDAENRLIGAASNGNFLATNRYDFMSRRIEKATSTETNAFLYDGWSLIRETICSASASTTNHDIWGLDLSGTRQGAGGIGGLLMQHHSNTNLSLFSFCDANGNITDLLDENAFSVAHYGYDSFGNAILQTGDSVQSNPLRYSTKFFNQELDVYCYEHRNFKNILGRWIERDKIGERGGKNIYAFVLNNPICFWDSLGLQAKPYYAPDVGLVVPDEFFDNPPDYRIIPRIDEKKLIQYEEWARVDRFDPRKCVCIIKRYKAVYEFSEMRKIFSIYVATPADPSEEIRKTAWNVVTGLLPRIGSFISAARGVSDMSEIDKRAGGPDLRGWQRYGEVEGKINISDKRKLYEGCYDWVSESAESAEECPVGHETDKWWSSPVERNVDINNRLADERFALELKEGIINLQIGVYLNGR